MKNSQITSFASKTISVFLILLLQCLLDLCCSECLAWMLMPETSGIVFWRHLEVIWRRSDVQQFGVWNDFFFAYEMEKRRRMRNGRGCEDILCRAEVRLEHCAHVHELKRFHLLLTASWRPAAAQTAASLFKALPASVVPSWGASLRVREPPPLWGSTEAVDSRTSGRSC